MFTVERGMSLLSVDINYPEVLELEASDHTEVQDFCKADEVYEKPQMAGPRMD